MADVNALYVPTIDVQDPDYITGYRPSLIPFTHGDPIYLPEELRQQIRINNANAVATAQAVQKPFSGSTSDERSVWALSVVQAVNNRVEFIKQRCGQLLSSLQANNDSAYNSSLKIFQTGLSLVPGLGSAINYIANQSTTESAIDQVKMQTLIQDYANELQQLATLRDELIKDYLTTAATTNDPTAKAPTVSNIYWYVGGALLLILLIIIIRRRNTKR